MSERQPADGGSGEERPAVDGEQPTGTDPMRRPSIDADAVDGGVDGRPGSDGTGAVTFPPAPVDLVVDAAIDHGPVEQVAVATSPAEPVADGTVEHVDATTTASGAAVDPLPVAPDDAVESAIESAIERMPTGTTVDHAGTGGTEPRFAAGDGAESTVESTTPPADLGPAVEPAGQGDDVAGTGAASGPAAAGGTAAETTVTESTVAMAAGTTTVDRRPLTEPPADTSATTAETDDAGTVPNGLQATAGDLETAPDTSTGNRPSPPDTTDLVEPVETQIEAGSDETVEQPVKPAENRPPSGWTPAGPSPAPVSTPTRATSVVETSNPAPELVELQTTGLAERLRPALAAVRRSVNGLEELRLRIQDDNAGPIKVDISTIDNRVRVLLSAGNDDLMRQLGQERDRLADELRRAGFDQASIDIESNGRGRRQGRYDQQGSDGSGSGVGGSLAETMGPVDRVQPQRQRGLTGLDLDL